MRVLTLAVAIVMCTWLTSCGQQSTQGERGAPRRARREGGDRAGRAYRQDRPAGSARSSRRSRPCWFAGSGRINTHCAFRMLLRGVRDYLP
jgi:hypothetical protein